jgi:hypothetical protein
MKTRRKEYKQKETRKVVFAVHTDTPVYLSRLGPNSTELHIHSDIHIRFICGFPSAETRVLTARRYLTTLYQQKRLFSVE